MASLVKGFHHIRTPCAAGVQEDETFIGGDR
jgi:hypothetical protein